MSDNFKKAHKAAAFTIQVSCTVQIATTLLRTSSHYHHKYDYVRELGFAIICIIKIVFVSIFLNQYFI